jgi:hypothetical protein
MTALFQGFVSLQVDLTEDYLLGLDPPVNPIVAGDHWDGRFQVLDAAGAAVDLTGAKIALAARKTEVDTVEVFKRDSVTDVAGEAVGTKQIAIDAGQGSEVGETGRGWFTVRFRKGDEATLLGAVASRLYDVRIKFGDGSTRLFCAGRLQVRRPITSNANIPA